MVELYYDDELYELGWGFSKIFKKAKKVLKRVGKKVKKVAKKATYVAAGVLGGALGAAVQAADQYVSSYQVPPPSSSAPRRVPRPQVYATYESGNSSYITFPTNNQSQNWQKYLPWIIGGGALLLLAGRK